jgi:ABC-2 type transport system ATP-binding protein
MERTSERAADVAIVAQELSMTYRAPLRQAGLGAAARSLFRRQYRSVEAVRAVTFRVHPGEVVGFLGPNGAGKTTTLKLLSGVLHPTAGGARVLGRVPWRREHAHLRQIAFVRGSRPIGAPPELTVLDALRFQRLVYEVPEGDFRRQLEELVALLGLAPLLQRQVRALSLGERMRAGLATALVYRPRVLFLDEPTIGLDVSATAAVRRFVAEYARRTGATVLLTSHYMADVQALCRRVLLIDGGRLRYDGALDALSARLAPWKLLRVALTDPGAAPGTDSGAPDGGPGAVGGPGGADWSRFGELVAVEGGRVSLRVARADVPSVTARLLAELPVADLAVEEAPLESVIDRAYRGDTDGALGPDPDPDPDPESQPHPESAPAPAGALS